jgi:hypothetical protein
LLEDDDPLGRRARLNQVSPQADFFWAGNRYGKSWRPAGTAPKCKTGQGVRGAMISGPAFGMRYLDDDDRVTRQQIKPGTVRRVLPYFTRYRWTLVFLFFITAVDSAITVANPLVPGFIVDDGILRRRVHVVVVLSLAIAGRHCSTRWRRTSSPGTRPGSGRGWSANCAPACSLTCSGSR